MLNRSYLAILVVQIVVLVDFLLVECMLWMYVEFCVEVCEDFLVNNMLYEELFIFM